MMPYLVMLCVTVITCLIGIVKVYADKLITQLQANKASTDEATDAAKATTTIAASNAIALGVHTSQAAAKLDTIIQQTNGINEKLTQTVADQQKKIEDLTSKQV
jgi:hypothetical protein